VEAETGAFRAFASPTLNLLEGFKQLDLVLRPDTDSCIHYGHLNAGAVPGASPCEGEVNATRLREFDGIVGEVNDDLAEGPFIGQDFQGTLGHMGLQSQS